MKIGYIRLLMDTKSDKIFWTSIRMLCTLLCTGTLIQLSLGQSPVSFRKISKKDGLSQSSVFAITQDRDGFIWIGTRDGLNKYDGYGFKVYNHSENENNLVSNDIRSLYFDSLTNYLWVGTIAGLCKFRPEYDDFIGYDHLTETHLNNFAIRLFYRDTKQRMWVGTSQGLFLYDDAKDRFVRYAAELDNPESLSGSDVKVIYEDAKGTLWFGSEQGLDTLIENPNGTYSFNSIQLDPQFTNLHIKSILEEDDGTFWIGTHANGVLIWDVGKGKVDLQFSVGNPNHTLSNNNIRAMAWGKPNELWVGTFDGLNRIEVDLKKTTIFRHDPSNDLSISHNSVRALFLDQRQSLWVGTYFGAINFFDEANNRFKNYTVQPYKNSLSHNVVSCFSEDGKHNWWIGTEGGGINYFDREAEKFSSYQHDPNDTNTISSNNVKSLLLQDGKLWIGTFNGGLDVLDTKTKKIQRYSSHLSRLGQQVNNVYNIAKNNEYLWLGTFGGGLKILNLNNDEVHTFVNDPRDPSTMNSNLIRSILITKDNQKWISTEEGVNKVISEQDGVPTTFNRYLDGKKIYILKEDSQGYIWAGSLSNGVYKLSPEGNVLANYTTKDGLPGYFIIGILEDSLNNLWLSTNNGISKFDPSNKSFTNYNFSDGLKNIEFNYNAYYRTSSGAMLFGGIEGMTVFNPQDIYDSDFVPPVVFTKLLVQNEEVKVNKNGILSRSINETENIKLDYTQSSFTISFASLDYFSSLNNTFAYKLEGLDKDWLYTKGLNQANYTIQNPGDYVFRLKGGNSDGLWNDVERKINIKILPPPWKSRLAYSVYGLVLLLATISLIRYIRLRNRFKLEQVTQRQQKELHEMKVRFFTNITHEFRTPLTLIMGHIEGLLSLQRELKGDAISKVFSIKKNTDRLLNLVNQLLTFRKIETDHIQIQAERHNLVSFLNEIYNSFQNDAIKRNINLTFKKVSEEIWVWFDADKLEKVFYNLLSNAFKFTPTGGKISLELFQSKHEVKIIVGDSGKGIDPKFHKQIFKRFYENDLPFQRSIKGSGIGLAISKQMVELHDGSIAVESQKGQGAKFIITLLKGREHFKPGELISITEGNRKLIQNRSEVPSIIKGQEIRPAIPSAPLPKNASKILIVEDNIEILNYLNAIFVNEFIVDTVDNGKAALRKAKTFEPDIILSDLMMPEMDGIEFCKKIKADIKTRHIPVIILTARAASEYKIHGLENGADDYVTKPFDPNELKLRVRNLTNARIDLRNRFSRILNLTPTEVKVSSADEAFLKNALDIVEKNMDNSDFSVVQLAYELSVSRALLFTKLKAIANLTPNNFIKSIRIKRAAQILKQKKLNVSEVAYRVGFKDPKYFSKCFQKQFNKTPSQYVTDYLENSNA